jgi:hypothetical protein
MSGGGEVVRRRRREALAQARHEGEVERERAQERGGKGAVKVGVVLYLLWGPGDTGQAISRGYGQRLMVLTPLMAGGGC